MIRVRFSANHKPLSLLVRGLLFSQVSHVEFEMPDGTFVGSHLMKGKTLRNDKRYPIEIFYTLNITKSQELELSDWIENQIDKPYDYTALFNNKIMPRKKKVWHDESMWICSEFVAAGLKRIGAKFPEGIQKIDPSYLYDEFRSSNQSYILV